MIAAGLVCTDINVADVVDCMHNLRARLRRDQFDIAQLIEAVNVCIEHDAFDTREFESSAARSQYFSGLPKRRGHSRHDGEGEIRKSVWFFIEVAAVMKFERLFGFGIINDGVAFEPAKSG